MKRINSLLLLATLTFHLAKGQDTEKRVVSQGQHSFNFYYGVSLFTGVYKAVAVSDALDLKFKTVGPVGMVYEYMVSDEIGIGAEGGYTQFTMTYTDPGVNPYGLKENYWAEWQFTTIRAMFRANFHFSKNESFDAYGLVSAGYRRTNFTFKTNDPSYDGNVSFNGFFPFGIKPGLGFRYFFTKNVGLNVELAAGTPIMCGGVSFKF